jgi:hypothetical protein
LVGFWSSIGDHERAQEAADFMPLQENTELDGVYHPIVLGRLAADLLEAGRAAILLNGVFLEEVEQEGRGPPCNYSRGFRQTTAGRDVLFQYTDEYLGESLKH